MRRERKRDNHRDMATFGIVDPMVVIDDEGQIVSLNPAAQRLLGASPIEVMGQRLETVWPTALGPLDLGALDQGADGKTVLHRNGHGRPRHAQVNPVFGPENERIGRVIIFSGCSRLLLGDDLTSEFGRAEQAKAGDGREPSAVSGTESDVANVLAHVAWQLGQTADATSVYVCGWDSNLGIAIVLAEYIGPQASPCEQISDLGSCYVDSQRQFMGALQQGQHWVAQLDDPSMPANDRQHMERYDARSILYIPFLVRGQLVGWAEIWESRRRRSFSRRTVELAENVARIAAVAIDKAQIYERLQEELGERERAEEALKRANDQLEQHVSARSAELAETNRELLREVTERRQAEADLLQRNRVLLSLQSAMASTTGSLDLDFVLDSITWEMSHLLGVESCTIYSWEGASDILTPLAWGPGGSSVGPEPIDLNGLLLYRRVLAETSTANLTARQEDLDPSEVRFLESLGAKTLVLIPMVFHGRTMGLIELKDSAVERVLCDYEVSAAQLLTSQAAAAIENARLYRHAQREIIDRIYAEDRLRVSLKEKEVLLKEIHHRVKNNLQVISSMLSLQALAISDPEALNAFAESQDRIRSMALIHEKLYRSADLAGIDFGGYLEDLAGYLVRSYQRGERPIDLHIEADGIRLAVDQAVPCGLIVNELVSNALKHAFPAESEPRSDGRRDAIRIDLAPMGGGRLQLRVADTGIGFRDPVVLGRTDSLGLQIVKTLTNQLDGEIVVRGSQGAEFTITFPEAAQ